MKYIDTSKWQDKTQNKNNDDLVLKWQKNTWKLKFQNLNPGTYSTPWWRKKDKNLFLKDYNSDSYTYCTPWGDEPFERLAGLGLARLSDAGFGCAHTLSVWFLLHGPHVLPLARDRARLDAIATANRTLQDQGMNHYHLLCCNYLCWLVNRS